MKANPVMYSTLIIRSQVEYSTTQSVILRCVLEMPATGQRRGFTDLDDLLVALRAELMELQRQIIPLDQKSPKGTAVISSTSCASDPES